MIVFLQLVKCVWKNIGGILGDRVRRVTRGLIDDDQGGFRAAGWECVGQILTLKQIGEKAREEKRSVVRFHRFGEGVR